MHGQVKIYRRADSLEPSATHCCFCRPLITEKAELKFSLERAPQLLPEPDNQVRSAGGYDAANNMEVCLRFPYVRFDSRQEIINAYKT
jgi:hypothetical protein